MQDNRKINKRPKSITEFRSSYSDNKNNYNSTDKASRQQTVIKYVLIAVFLAFVALGAFLLTDALINISETPYTPSTEQTTNEESTDIDEKYFENQVDVPADKVGENDNNSDMRE